MDYTIIRLPQVIARTGLSRSSIYAKIAIGQFPEPVRLGSRSVGWLEREVAAWAAERVAERPTQRQYEDDEE